MENDLEYKQLHQIEHVKLRPNMYVGSTEVQSIEMYILENEKFVLKDVSFSPALLKIFDEILCNATDHYIRNPKKVTKIEISFNKASKTISVKNDGPGIPIKMVDTLHDGKKYQPEAIFSQCLSGSNFGEEREGAGMNGLGAKLTNIFSDVFYLETQTKGKLYKQTFYDRLTVINNPVIEILNHTSKEDYTKIEFVPNYLSLGYTEYNEAISNDIYKIIEARAYQAAAFVSCDVYFNDTLLDINSFEDFAEMFINNEYGYISVPMSYPNISKKEVWNVCIGISDGKPRHVSLINGINVFTGGTHIKHIQSTIVDAIRDKVEKELIKTKGKSKEKERFNVNPIKNNLFIFFKATIPNPTFASQTKDKLTNPEKSFKDFAFKAKDEKTLWEFLGDHVMSTIFGKMATKKKTKTNKKIILTKGEDAKYAGHPEKYKDCTLIICEGNSAMVLVNSGIDHARTSLQKDFVGTLSIQGVPPNALKESSLKKDKKTGKEYRISSNKLKNNKRFHEVMLVLGLDENKSYDRNTQEGQNEFATLRYGRVVAAVDQDDDGKGQIFGLLVNFFMLYWPNLADWNFIQRFNTPIIRAFPLKGNKVKEFYTRYEFDQWLEHSYHNDKKRMLDEYTPKYYKGLSSHDSDEVLPTFSNFEKKIYIYKKDEKYRDSLEIYFGAESDLRKDILCYPVNPDDEIKNETDIEITRFLNTDTKGFQLDNITRKLKHFADGLSPASRKAFYIARKIFTTDKKEEMKVCNFTGAVMQNANYHHGDASLSGTVTSMAQNFVGAKNLPLLIGIGQFGIRKTGVKEHGQPRYISVKLNRKLSNAICPLMDDFLLPYPDEDGKRAEPSYYVPVIPMSILENTSIPATGWKIETWARDYKAVIKNVRRMISGEITNCKRMTPWMRKNNCEIRYGSDGFEYMVGKYEINGNILHIRELPLGIWNDSYIRSIAYKGDELKPEFEDVHDLSTYDETKSDVIDIQFKMKSGVLDQWMNSLEDEDICNGIEKNMKLCKKMTSHLNFIKADGSVIHYTTYSKIVDDWFELRKKLYALRIERMIILNELRILRLKNIIRFTEERTQYGITDKTPESKFIEILELNKYDAFNSTLLNNPEYTAVHELKKMITDKNRHASYEYIIGLTYRQLLSDSCVKRKEELKKMESELNELLADSVNEGGRFPGQNIWLKELDKVEEVIDHGMEHGWKPKKNYKFGV